MQNTLINYVLLSVECEHVTLSSGILRVSLAGLLAKENHKFQQQ